MIMDKVADVESLIAKAAAANDATEALRYAQAAVETASAIAKIINLELPDIPAAAD